MNPKIIIVLGPTAVGKSEVAMDIALRIGGEIISADSLQVYRYLDVGTGKPRPDQREAIPHHLIDLLDPDEEFNVALFRDYALKADQDIRNRGKKTVVCGGTGLYIKALIHGLFVGPGRNQEVRRGLEDEMRTKGLAWLYDRLKQVDPIGAEKIHPNDRQRILRGLEVFDDSGTVISQWQGEHGFKQNDYDVFKIGLHRERSELYELINNRCDEMMAMGLVEEVKGLMDRGYSLDLKPLQSVGYRHVGHFLTGTMGFEESLAFMKRDTRRLAKRQLTWFRSDPEIHWFHPDQERDKILAAATSFLS
ncbi:MAG: tRNA (adenosine(37)-N6)-dimethylallyltransferase MiaA [Deltaproteobacteria bacterium]|nr:tRNA (adenosine(37)-N6)-dimethylallyltransferase MiaA [Deltaproteobacteria bacterium]